MKDFSRAMLFSSFLLIAMIPDTSCRKFVVVGNPSTQLTSDAVYASDQTAEAALAGLYTSLASNGFADGSLGSITFLGGLSADELIDQSGIPDQRQFYQNGIQPSNQVLTGYLWGSLYNTIYQCNALYEGLQQSVGITAATKKQIQAEVKFIRAFCYYYLLQLFDQVPLITSTDYKTNAGQPAADRALVLSQILTDLKESQINLAADYAFANNERTRATSWAATALLARVGLLDGDWKDAVIQSSTLINASDQFSLNEDLNSVFLANSQEAIWQLQAVLPGQNTNEGVYFILDGTPATVNLNPALLQAFEPGDLRYSHWIDSTTDGLNEYYFPSKYKVQFADAVTEYSMVMRLAEQYLIRAEANWHMENFDAAVADLNMIRSRAGLPPITTNDPTEIQEALIQERRVELFTEWGHRWFDLKRNSLASSSLSPVKPGWKDTDTLYPIPSVELQNDRLLKQNPGY